MAKPFLLGLAASLFFAATFVLNRSMQLDGGSWLWTASLRYLFTLPVLWLLTRRGGRQAAVWAEIRRRPGAWTLWSLVGFGVFYCFVCLAAAYGPAWMLAATWQLTIVAGIALTPLFRAGGAAGGARHRLPLRQLAVALVILGGVALVQAGRGWGEWSGAGWLCLGCMALAGVAYPLGNRKMLQVAPASMGTIDRIFGMTVCSLPLWLALPAAALATGAAPSPGQVLQSALVALSSGVVATVLFFKATEMARGDVRQLAVVESTQAGELVFAFLGGLAWLGDPLPSPLSWLGVGLVLAGMLYNGFASGRRAGARR